MVISIMSITCNICNCEEFIEFGDPPRKNARCKNCFSLERHRAIYHILKAKELLVSTGYERCLHIAPEKILHSILYDIYKSGYITTDILPQIYQHAQCLKLNFPDQYNIFPSNYFDLVIHNHILEHIPGNFKNHIDELVRIIKPNCKMMFTIPSGNVYRNIYETIEGGEFLESDDERIKLFGQKDHVKVFGTDLIEYLQSKFTSVELLADPRTDKILIDKHNAVGTVFYCIK